MGMKDGLTASIASQGTLSDSPRASLANSPSPVVAGGGAAGAAAKKTLAAGDPNEAAALRAVAAKEKADSSSEGRKIQSERELPVSVLSNRVSLTINCDWNGPIYQRWPIIQYST